MVEPVIKKESIPIGGVSVMYYTVEGNSLKYSENLDLKKEILDYVDEKTRGVCIDLSAIAIIDSYALGVMAGMTSRLASKGAPMALVGVNSKMMSVFEHSGMQDLFLFFDNRDEAIQYFHNRLHTRG